MYNAAFAPCSCTSRAGPISARFCTSPRGLPRTNWIKVSTGIAYRTMGRACTPGGNRAMLAGGAARQLRALLLQPDAEDPVVSPS